MTLNTLSRLKGIETHVFAFAFVTPYALNPLSRLKGIETSISRLVPFAYMNSEYTFPFEGN